MESQYPTVSAEEFADSLGRLLAPEPGIHLACAVSGGSDSMALLLLASKWAVKHQGMVTALIIDHRIRPESTQECLDLVEQLNSLGIPCERLSWENHDVSGNLQQNARNARYRLMTEWCHNNGATFLLTGHHADDQAETLLLRLKRGSHITGLAGIPAKRQQEGITLLRPLLGFSKERLRATLRASGWSWLEDPSNASDQYDRNSLRQMLSKLPDEMAIRDKLVNSAIRFAALRQKEEEKLFQDWQAHAQTDRLGFIRISGEYLDMANTDVCARLLQAAITTVSGSNHPPRFAEAESLAERLNEDDSFKATLGGCLILKSGKKYNRDVFVIRELNAVTLSSANGRFDNRFEIDLPADNFLGHLEPLGETGRLALKQAGELENLELPKEIFEALPGVRHLEEWILLPNIKDCGGNSGKNGLNFRFLPAKPLAGEPFYSL